MASSIWSQQSKKGNSNVQRKQVSFLPPIMEGISSQLTVGRNTTEPPDTIVFPSLQSSDDTSRPLEQVKTPANCFVSAGTSSEGLDSDTECGESTDIAAADRGSKGLQTKFLGSRDKEAGGVNTEENVSPRKEMRRKSRDKGRKRSRRTSIRFVSNPGNRRSGLVHGGIYRAVVKFAQPPKTEDLCVCFNFPQCHKFLNHRSVLALVKKTLDRFAQVDAVQTIQFEDMNVKLGTHGMDNRWIITLKNNTARNILLKQGLCILSRHVKVHVYSDIIEKEYQDFIQHVQLQMALLSTEERGQLKMLEN